jgi:hypothetical protein
VETVATLQAELLTLDGAHNAKKREQIKLRIAELDLASAVPIPALVKAEFGAEAMCLSDEIAAEQREELEALAAIYEDDFELKGSPPAKQGDSKVRLFYSGTFRELQNCYAIPTQLPCEQRKRQVPFRVCCCCGGPRCRSVAFGDY